MSGTAVYDWRESILVKKGKVRYKSDYEIKGCGFQPPLKITAKYYKTISTQKQQPLSFYKSQLQTDNPNYQNCKNNNPSFWLQAMLTLQPAPTRRVSSRSEAASHNLPQRFAPAAFASSILKSLMDTLAIEQASNSHIGLSLCLASVIEVCIDLI